MDGFEFLPLLRVKNVFWPDVKWSWILNFDGHAVGLKEDDGHVYGILFEEGEVWLLFLYFLKVIFTNYLHSVHDQKELKDLNFLPNAGVSAGEGAKLVRNNVYSCGDHLLLRRKLNEHVDWHKILCGWKAHSKVNIEHFRSPRLYETIIRHALNFAQVLISGLIIWVKILDVPAMWKVVSVMSMVELVSLSYP